MHLPAWRSGIDPVQVSILSLSAALTQLQQWRLQVVLHFPFNKHPSGLILACGFTFGNVILQSHPPELVRTPPGGCDSYNCITVCATLDIFLSALIELVTSKI